MNHKYSYIFMHDRLSKPQPSKILISRTFQQKGKHKKTMIYYRHLKADAYRLQSYHAWRLTLRCGYHLTYFRS